MSAERIDFTDPTTWDREFTDQDALSLGLWAANTLIAPDASSKAQFAAFDFFGEATTERLAAMRDRLEEK